MRRMRRTLLSLAAVAARARARSPLWRLRRRRQRLHAGRLATWPSARRTTSSSTPRATRPTPGCVEVTYTNEGSIAHTLLIKGESDFKLAVGDTDTGTVELPAGSYELYCDIAGHEAAGMEADLSRRAERSGSGRRAGAPSRRSR